jgi:predicted nucleic acid-binding protein
LVKIIPLSFIDLEIADLAVNYRKVRKIKLADSLILATARKLNADLISSNIDDFINIDKNVNVIKPTKIL